MHFEEVAGHAQGHGALDGGRASSFLLSALEEALTLTWR